VLPINRLPSPTIHSDTILCICNVYLRCPYLHTPRVPQLICTDVPTIQIEWVTFHKASVVNDPDPSSSDAVCLVLSRGRFGLVEWRKYVIKRFVLVPTFWITIVQRDRSGWVVQLEWLWWCFLRKGSREVGSYWDHEWCMEQGVGKPGLLNGVAGEAVRLNWSSSRLEWVLKNGHP